MQDRGLPWVQRLPQAPLPTPRAAKPCPHPCPLQPVGHRGPMSSLEPEALLMDVEQKATRLGRPGQVRPCKRPISPWDQAGQVGRWVGAQPLALSPTSWPGGWIGQAPRVWALPAPTCCPRPSDPVLFIHSPPATLGLCCPCSIPSWGLRAGGGQGSLCPSSEPG